MHVISKKAIIENLFCPNSLESKKSPIAMPKNPANIWQIVTNTTPNPEILPSNAPIKKGNITLRVLKIISTINRYKTFY